MHRSRAVLLVGLLALAALSSMAARAQAAEKIFWDNYEERSISYADIDGSGGGPLDLSGVEPDGPEGMAFDPSQGRIYAAASEANEIVWAAVDGSGGGVLDTAGAPVEFPIGVTIDPRSQTIYWANGESPGSIGWARLDGSGGGTLDTAPVTVDEPESPAIDLADDRLYWVDGGTGTFFSAALGGGGGRELPLAAGAPAPEDIHGVDIDPAAGRLYWLDNGFDAIGWTSLSGLGGGEIATAGANFSEPYGLAFDPDSGRFYWGNWGNGTERRNAIGTVTLSGVTGGITPATAPVGGPQDPVVLKSPTGTGAPRIDRSGTTLSCSRGEWAPDDAGSYVYGAPTSYSYRWLRDGTPIRGAIAAVYTVFASGSYSCAVTGRNVTGSATQTSAPIAVSTTVPTAAASPAKLSLALLGRKAHARAGGTALVSLRLANEGGTSSTAVKVCGRLARKVKKALVAPRCVSVGPLTSGSSATVTLRVKTHKTAKGTYKFTVRVEGATVDPVTARVKVTAKKKRRGRRH
ncbi:MAG TPA: hypothetical protein VHE08_01545 [Solirubrobacterales bacterium]|nr:hypothetical protein [Solirubrobacterales bacterium]